MECSLGVSGTAGSGDAGMTPGDSLYPFPSFKDLLA